MLNVVYCLLRDDKKQTYIGSTMNMERRLRQHNCEIVGGAKYTSKSVKLGHKWIIAFTLLNFPTWNETLKMEWMIKHITKKINIKDPLQRRLQAVDEILKSGKSTSSSLLFSSYENPIELNLT